MSPRGVPQLEIAEVTDDNDLLQTGTAAANRARCTNPEHSDKTLFTTVQVYADGVDDRAVGKKLALSYTQALENSPTCRHQKVSTSPADSPPRTSNSGS